jgi:hypothetical protein
MYFSIFKRTCHITAVVDTNTAGLVERVTRPAPVAEPAPAPKKPRRRTSKKDEAPATDAAAPDAAAPDAAAPEETA